MAIGPLNQFEKECSMAIHTVLAEVAVSDLEASLAWYEQLLGSPADRRPMEGLAEWQITASAGIQVWRDSVRAGQGLLTLGVDAMHEHLELLAARNIAIEAQTATEFVRTATVVDPDGNRITVA